MSAMPGPSNMMFVAGVAKAGTTALYYYLSQHPDLFLPEKKELHFFSRPDIERCMAGPGDPYVLDEIPDSYDRYVAHYSGADAGQVCVDVSPSCFDFPDAARRTLAAFPRARAVILLRNPVEKAFSQYMHLRSVGRETLDFRAALRAEDERRASAYSLMWMYRGNSYYAEKLAAWRDAYGEERLRVYLFDEFRASPLDVVRDACRHFGVRDDVAFTDPGQVNASGVPKSRLVSSVLLKPNPFTRFLRRVVPAGLGREVREWIRSMNSGAPAEFPDDLRRELLDGYADDIRRVESMLGRETGWLR